MPYFRGRDVEVFISTEDSTYGISASGVSDVDVAAWTDSASLISDYIVPPLKTDADWIGTETDETGSAPARGKFILDLESLDLEVDKEREDIDFLGRVVTDHITVRKKCEITVNRKMDTNEWGVLYDKADAALTGSGGSQAINEAIDQTTTNSGFRLFIKISPSTGSNEFWYSCRNLTFTKHKVTPTPAKTTVEALTFAGNIYDIGGVPSTATTEETEL